MNEKTTLNLKYTTTALSVNSTSLTGGKDWKIAREILPMEGISVSCLENKESFEPKRLNITHDKETKEQFKVTDLVHLRSQTA